MITAEQAREMTNEAKKLGISKSTIPNFWR